MVAEPYRVLQRGVEIEFALEDGEDERLVGNVDAVIETADGLRWGATLLTVREVERILTRWAASGECESGLYIRVPDLIVMSEPGVDQMVKTILDLVQSIKHRSLTPL